MDKPKLFMVADFAVDTGFAQVAHNIADGLYDRWDITVLAINYYGDYHPYQQKFKLFSPSAEGDVYGYNRIRRLTELIKPDLIFLINDPWVNISYISALKDLVKKYPVTMYMPVDGFNLKKEWVSPLNAAKSAIAYTNFAQKELVHAGLTIPSYVIPHGVDTSVFYPESKEESRNRLGLDQDWYIVNVTDRNSHRKRIDLALQYFARWVQLNNHPPEVKIYYHGALKDTGWDIIQLAEYFGIGDRLILTSPHITPAKGVDKNDMRVVYSVADVGISTSMGEGWGLTAMERMACGVPMILPHHSAFAEWAENVVEYVQCGGIYANTQGLNTIGMVPDRDSMVNALEFVYNHPEYRSSLARKGYERVTADKFSWKTIANEFDKVFQQYIRKEVKDNG